MNASLPIYTAQYAAVLVQLAGAANQPLGAGSQPSLPAGWSLLRTVLPDGLPALQAFFAQGTLPTAGPVVVLAVGAPWASLMDWYVASYHRPDPYTAPGSPVTGAAFDEGYQNLYGLLGPALWKAVGIVPKGLPLVVTGHGQAAPLAQLAALDFAPPTASQKTPFSSASLCLFSAPALGNASFATIIEQSLSAAWAVTAQGLTPVDFFPSAPTAAEGYVLGGTAQPLQAALPARDDPWWERSTTFYDTAFGNPARADVTSARAGARRPRAASLTGAPPYDPDLAYALAVLSAVAYQRAQHPLLPFDAAPWTLLGDVATAGVTWASVFTTPGPPADAAIVFRGTVSWEELFTYGADTFLTQGNVLPNGAVVANGAWTVYSALRAPLFALLATVPGLGSRSLYVAGHSFGGSLATVCLLDLQAPPAGVPVPTALYTYGAPPVVSEVLAFTWPYAANTFRFARVSDIVPALSYSGALGQVPTLVPLSGSTKWDDVTWHPISSYIELLDPRSHS